MHHKLKKNSVTIVAFFLFTFQIIHAQKALKLQKYVVEYTVKNVGINSKGKFDNVAADVVFDETMLDKSSISATIQTNSFNSGMTMRDNHLKDKDYFDVKNYPTITLVSTKIVRSGNQYLGTFNLTLKNITKSVQLPFTILKKDNTLEFSTTDLNIDRTVYGIGKSSLALSKTVRITINATFTN